MGDRSLLGQLAPASRVAFVTPVDTTDTWPGEKLYERSIGTIRGRNVDMFLLMAPHGMIPESSAARHPEIRSYVTEPELRVVGKDTAAGVRAWLDSNGMNYKRIVVLDLGGLGMTIWNRAVAGSPASRKVRLVKVYRGVNLTSDYVRRTLKSAVS
jgi:hypothetical protein